MDDLAELFGNPWTARRALPAQLSPVVANALGLPGDDRPGLDEYQRGLPTGPEAGQPSTEQAIGLTEARAMEGLLVNRQLMPQRQMFQTQGRPGAEESHGEGQQSREDREHDQRPPHHRTSAGAEVRSSRVRMIAEKVKSVNRFRFSGQTGDKGPFVITDIAGTGLSGHPPSVAQAGERI